MKIVCISDTHGLHRKLLVPDGDILIHAGDISTVGELDTISDFNSWLGKLPHTYKIVIAGNHDFSFEKEAKASKKLLTNAIYLNNSGVEIAGLKIWGSPHSPISPKFGSDWAFNIERGEKIKQIWEKIPTDIDILITHCPPKYILDKNDMGEHEGCEDLAKIVCEHILPRLHIFGHIHEAYGKKQVADTLYINASIVGLRSWINNYIILRKLRHFAIYIFQIIKAIRKNILGISAEKLANKTFSRFNWSIKNPPIVIEIV